MYVLHRHTIVGIYGSVWIYTVQELFHWQWKEVATQLIIELYVVCYIHRKWIILEFSESLENPSCFHHFSFSLMSHGYGCVDHQRLLPPMGRARGERGSSAGWIWILHDVLLLCPVSLGRSTVTIHSHIVCPRIILVLSSTGLKF